MPRWSLFNLIINAPAIQKRIIFTPSVRSPYRDTTGRTGTSKHHLIH